MTTSGKLWTAALALLIGGLFSTPALAEKAAGSYAGVLHVQDDAKLFSDSGVKKAKDLFDGTKFKAETHLRVITKNEFPSHLANDFANAKDVSAANKLMTQWAEDLATREPGIIMLVYSKGDKFLVKVKGDRQADKYRGLGDSKAKDVSDHMISAMRKAKGLKGDEATAARDEGLYTVSAEVIKDLENTTVPESKTSANNKASGGSGIMGYVCLGICVLLGVWLVIGLIRAFTGGGGGGGGGGYGGGGGGGGFMTSFLGGMFGAAAGMWMYDHFLGNSMSSASAGDFSSGNDVGDTGGGDYSSGADAGGGDWGDSGGGDTGGGDWGGGGDGGGGGDFGGGDW